jgi:hypothetical protein
VKLPLTGDMIEEAMAANDEFVARLEAIRDAAQGMNWIKEKITVKVGWPPASLRWPALTAISKDRKIVMAVMALAVMSEG